MKIYVCGDTHASIDYEKISKFNTDENDILIQLGDWGAIWHNRDNKKGFIKDCKLQIKWSKKNFTTLVVPGNHDNYDMINKLNEKEMFGRIVKELVPYNPYNNKKYKSIYILNRGEIYEIDNRKFLALSGALSIDKNYRVEGESYWKNELWNYEEEKRCLENLDKNNWEVDYVISHTCPSSVADIILAKYLNISYNAKITDPTVKFFQFLLDNGLKFKEWHFGHFHIDKKISDKFYCHYNNEPKLICES